MQSCHPRQCVNTTQMQVLYPEDLCRNLESFPETAESNLSSVPNLLSPEPFAETWRSLAAAGWKQTTGTLNEKLNWRQG